MRNIPAIVEAWYPGQAEGMAIARGIIWRLQSRWKITDNHFPKQPVIYLLLKIMILPKVKLICTSVSNPSIPLDLGLVIRIFEVSNESMLKQQLSKE